MFPMYYLSKLLIKNNLKRDWKEAYLIFSTEFVIIIGVTLTPKCHTFWRNSTCMWQKILDKFLTMLFIPVEWELIIFSRSLYERGLTKQLSYLNRIFSCNIIYTNNSNECLVFSYIDILQI